VGFRYFLAHARDAGAITRVEEGNLWERGWQALQLAGAAQSAHIQVGEPASHFLRLVQAVIASGQAHLADPEGNEPPNALRWGWSLEESGGVVRVQRHGPCIGWVADGQVYLEPEASYAVAQRLAQAQGEAIPITSTTLRRRLKERKLLASMDAQRGKLTVRRTFQGLRREVLHVTWPGTVGRSETGPTGPEEGEVVESREEERGDAGADEGAEIAAEGEEVARTPAQETGRNDRDTADVGQMGRMGRQDEGCTASDWGEWQ
jgi:hypothetical protein